MNDVQLADAYVLRRQGAAQRDALDWLQGGQKPTPHNVPAQETPEKTDALETAGKVARDVGRGMIDAPGAIVSGAANAVNEAIDLADGVAGWVESASGLGGLDISADGVKVLSAEQLAAKRAKGEDVASQMRVPTAEWMQPDSVTGGLVQGVSQFLVGFGVASKALKGTKLAAGLGQWGTSMAAGAAADAAVFDEHSARLSNLVEQFPALKNPVTAYLSAKPDDGMAEGRLKNALEGLGLGLVTHGLGLALKAVRNYAQARGVDSADALAAAKQTGANLDTVDVEVKTIDPDGKTGVVTMKAGEALKQVDEGITTMKAILECLG